MNDLKPIEFTPAIQKMREEHIPQVGDVYVDKSCQGYRLFRITGIRENEHGRYMATEQYSFIRNTWEESSWSKEVHESDLKRYYSWVYDYEKVIKEAEAVFNGTAELQQGDELPSDSTALVRRSKTDLIAQMDEIEALRDRTEMVRSVVKAQVDEQMRVYEEKVRTLQTHCDGLRDKVEKLMRVVSVLEVYTGKELEITTITEGQGCAIDEPLTIRQRILFMDEEVAAIKEDWTGLDHYDTAQFYEWMKDPDNRDIIVPEQRCSVVMKPRRFDKRYSSDWRENELENRWNHHSFIVLRDGENVHIIESDNLYFSEAAIPTKKQWKSAMEALNSWHGNKRQAENLQYRSIFYMFLLQGMLDNTNYLGQHNGISLQKERNINIIFDGEDDTLLGTDIVPWHDFVKEKNKDLRRGSRILYLGQDGDFLRYYSSKWTQPAMPDRGMYNLEEIESWRWKEHGYGILYMPSDYTRTCDDRKQRVTWAFTSDWRSSGKVISFDNITSAELETYVKDRTQRKYYESIFPMLLKLLQLKRKEEQLESAFKNAMRCEFKEEISDELFNEAIDWWKKKVIYVRALDKDDAKSWRMIKKYLTKRLQDGELEE